MKKIISLLFFLFLFSSGESEWVTKNKSDLASSAGGGVRWWCDNAFLGYRSKPSIAYYFILISYISFNSYSYPILPRREVGET